MAGILEIKAALAAEMAADVHAAMSKHADNKHTLVEFNDERTPHITKEDLLAFIELHVSHINEHIGRGRKLKVAMNEFMDDIVYSFYLGDNGENVGNIRLKPVQKTIGCADDVEGKEGELPE